jgi:hypothetical protein
MTWLLVLSLFSNADGNYVRTFNTEAECVKEMKSFVSKNKDNADVKYIGCSSTEADMASIEDEE